MEISVGDLRTDVIGGVAQVIGVALDGSTATGGMSDGDILVNNVAVPSSASPSARDKAIAINSVYYQTGVYARAEAAQTIATAAVGAGTLDLAVGDTLTINGYTLPREGTLVVAANDATGTLRRAINAVSHETGVAADIDATTGALVLTATNDEDFTYTMDTATTLGIVNLTGAAGVQETVFGRLRLYSDQAFTVADGTGTALTLIGITGSYGLDPTSVIETVDVTSFAKAQESLLKIDNALRQINDVRSGLGAITNRLENTVANMMISAENLSASDSRIRDADFAAETANMTRAQILQQSGVAVLAQANLTPQTALSLLK
ncbi:MAG TPA: flagellin, partial [Sumerlaeia bacterium]|nr:flagellin [Sumerlaeia bacterium]